MRTEAQMLDEFENANRGEGPDPIASFDGAALQMILAAVRDRNAAQDRIDAAVAQARSQGASWTLIGDMLGVAAWRVRQRTSTCWPIPTGPAQAMAPIYALSGPPRITSAAPRRLLKTSPTNVAAACSRAADSDLNRA